MGEAGTWGGASPAPQGPRGRGGGRPPPPAHPTVACPRPGGCGSHGARGGSAAGGTPAHTHRAHVGGGSRVWGLVGVRRGRWSVCRGAGGALGGLEGRGQGGQRGPGRPEGGGAAGPNNALEPTAPRAAGAPSTSHMARRLTASVRQR